MTATDRFLAEHGWGDAIHHPMVGDASSRRYVRLARGSDSAILMIDPQDDTARFAKIAHHLTQIGLSAPAVYALEPGLMLLEDFGDTQFARIILDNPAKEGPLYRVAVDVLIHLEQSQPPDRLHTATPDILGNMIAPFLDSYVPALGGSLDGHGLVACLTDLLSKHLNSETILLLRDYHAENMIWLPDRDDIRKVGLLDFQDALLGPPVYDLVSMLQDARRDVTAACQDMCIRRYVERSGRSETNVLDRYHLLGLQRNLRILGIFAKLATEQRKSGYLSLIPRVWSHIQNNLEAPVAAPLRVILGESIPHPTKQALEKLRPS